MPGIGLACGGRGLGCRRRIGEIKDPATMGPWPAFMAEQSFRGGQKGGISAAELGFASQEQIGRP